MYHRSILRAIMNYRINLVIKVLIMSDFLIFAAGNLLSPIFAIFVVQGVAGAGLEEVGICASIFYITKAVCEMPVGKYIDRTLSERDDLYTALLGTILISMVYLSYCFISQVWQLYLAQVALGAGAALAYPGWYTIFTRHIDNDKKGVEWSLYDVMMGIGMALSSALGAFIADVYGFQVLFVLVFVITLIGALLLIMIKNKIYIK